jgi:tRNA pseudouridine32 synthase/23S rRNA pseudouridine746 synthase
MLIDTILFIDGEAIVIDKPAGLAVTRPKRGGDCVEARLGELKEGFARSPMIVHRLDQDTSGCLLLARNPKALKRFNATFAEGGARKAYWAIIDGVPATEEGMIDLPLAKRSTRERGWWMEGDRKGKSARTAWRVLARKEACALLEFSPETGRTHQLRVHAKEGLGMPIIGDPVYGDGAKDGGSAMLLHARSLVVPRSGKPPVEASAPLPERFGSWDLIDDAAS